MTTVDRSIATPDWIDDVAWNDHGLVVAIAQEVGSGDVLMLAWMSREALAATLARGEAVYWSRSRQALWHKGDTSGHFQKVREIRLDCDGDAILLQVEQVGGVACHTGRHSCFYRALDGERWVDDGPSAHDHPTDTGSTTSGDDVLSRLAQVIESRRGGDPASSYVARLLSRGPDAVLKKIGEEATETVMAAKDGDRARIVAETADLWFHSLVMLAQYDLAPADVLAELSRREGLSGLDELAARKAASRDAPT